MSRAFTPAQKALLRSPDLHVNALATFYLDEGTYRFSDEQSGLDLIDSLNGHTYLGANAFAEAVEIRSSKNLVAEPVTLLLDGNRMQQAGVSDPARVLKDIMGYLYQQRRVDYALGFRFSYSPDLNLIIPCYAGKINHVRLIDKELNFGGESPRCVSYLEIVLDSLAARYNRATNRVRSHLDQKELDATDNFYSHTVDISVNERNLYWGRKTPRGVSSANGVTLISGSSGGFAGVLQTALER